MTEEIIRAITETEEKAADVKRAATLAAATVLENANKACKDLETAALVECRAYQEQQKKAAEESAEKAYVETLAKQEEAAKKYCEEILANVDTAVSTSKIVGRVTRGDY